MKAPLLVAIVIMSLVGTVAGLYLYDQFIPPNQIRFNFILNLR
jgi:hypothetical protein